MKTELVIHWFAYQVALQVANVCKPMRKSNQSSILPLRIITIPSIVLKTQFCISTTRIRLIVCKVRVPYKPHVLLYDIDETKLLNRSLPYLLML